MIILKLAQTVEMGSYQWPIIERYLINYNSWPEQGQVSRSEIATVMTARYTRYTVAIIAFLST
jgi:hypothetical protein